MKTKNKTVWYEDDLFWETLGPEIFNAEKIESAPQEVDKVLELLQLQPGARVLDLCCGIGRHSLELARRGFEVTGFDRTKNYLQKAEEQAKIEGLTIDFVQGDMRKFCALEEFDAVINLYTAFGYFEEQSDDKRVLLNAFASLKPGGKLLIELMSKEVLARIFKSREWNENNGVTFLRESKVTQSWSWVENRWILLKDGEKHEFSFGHRLYSAAELSGLLWSAGFRSVKVFGNLEGADYDNNAERLVVLATK
ncbi:MAG: class I SAM-dependent methyltransferase [Sedimentisphaerales bacterium]|nr:class I SAM-dependent methyltransferase [Sedimentisphaerales bacterium]